MKGKELLVRTDELIFYRNPKQNKIMEGMCQLFSEDGQLDISLYYQVMAGLYEYATENGFKGNLWHCYLTEVLVYSDNPYTVACEKRGTAGGSLSNAVLHDIKIFREMFAYDIRSLAKKVGDDGIEEVINYQNTGLEAIKYNKFIAKEVCALSEKLAGAKDDIEFRNYLDEFYKSYGVGVFGLHKAFRVEHTEKGLNINPIYNIAVTDLDDIVGYETAKQTLIDNTEAFLDGRKANNCLIFGAAGTGKSSSIRALLNTYYGQGLRMIEVYKHQYRELNELIDRLKVRNYKFIIYMDDLSFEEFETEYKYLKAVIEGGLESKPDNVLIYATSNRRHLVRENFDDKAAIGDIHNNETVQEKLSLFARFGVSVYFGSPDKKAFDNIVVTLAHRYQLPYSDEELIAMANKWELSHGGRSGRCARQFINDLRGKNVDDD